MNSNISNNKHEELKRFQSDTIKPAPALLRYMKRRGSKRRSTLAQEDSFRIEEDNIGLKIGALFFTWDELNRKETRIQRSTSCTFTFEKPIEFPKRRVSEDFEIDIRLRHLKFNFEREKYFIKNVPDIVNLLNDIEPENVNQF